jgi:chemotaxis protein CheX
VAWLDDKTVHEIETELKQRSEKVPLIIFDFQTVGEMHPQAMRSLARMTNEYSATETKTAFLVNEKLFNFISSNGMDRILRCIGDLKELLPKQNSPRDEKSRTLEFLNITLDAAVHTFKVATKTIISANKTFVKTIENCPTHDLAATVSIHSPEYNGTLILAFPSKTYLPVLNRLTGGNFDELTPEIRDGVAELLNIVLGQAKTQLNQRGFQIQQSIPTVIDGNRVNPGLTPGSRSIIIPFNCDVGDFFIELTNKTATPG